MRDLAGKVRAVISSKLSSSVKWAILARERERVKTPERRDRRHGSSVRRKRNRGHGLEEMDVLSENEFQQMFRLSRARFNSVLAGRVVRVREPVGVVFLSPARLRSALHELHKALGRFMKRSTDVHGRWWFLARARNSLCEEAQKKFFASSPPKNAFFFPLLGVFDPETRAT